MSDEGEEEVSSTQAEADFDAVPADETGTIAAAMEESDQPSKEAKGDTDDVVESSQPDEAADKDGDDDEDKNGIPCTPPDGHSDDDAAAEERAEADCDEAMEELARAKSAFDKSNVVLSEADEKKRQMLIRKLEEVKDDHGKTALVERRREQAKAVVDDIDSSRDEVELARQAEMYKVVFPGKPLPAIYGRGKKLIEEKATAVMDAMMIPSDAIVPETAVKPKRVLKRPAVVTVTVTGPDGIDLDKAPTWLVDSGKITKKMLDALPGGNPLKKETAASRKAATKANAAAAVAEATRMATAVAEAKAAYKEARDDVAKKTAAVDAAIENVKLKTAATKEKVSKEEKKFDPKETQQPYKVYLEVPKTVKNRIARWFTDEKTTPRADAGTEMMEIENILVCTCATLPSEGVKMKLSADVGKLRNAASSVDFQGGVFSIGFDFGEAYSSRLQSALRPCAASKWEKFPAVTLARLPQNAISKGMDLQQSMMKFPDIILEKLVFVPEKSREKSGDDTDSCDEGDGGEDATGRKTSSAKKKNARKGIKRFDLF